MSKISSLFYGKIQSYISERVKKVNNRFTLLKNAVAVHLEGELDQYLAAEVKSRIDIEMENAEKKNLIIDLEGVSLMDSSGIGLILGRYKILKSLGGGIAICSANESVRKVLKLSGIEKIIKYYENIDEADKAFKNK